MLHNLRLLENHRCRWEDDTELDLSNNGMRMLIWFDLIYMVQGRIWWQAHLNAILNLWFPWREGNIMTARVLTFLCFYVPENYYIWQFVSLYIQIILHGDWHHSALHFSNLLWVWDRHVLVHCTAIIIRISLTVFKEGAWNVFLRFAGMHHKKACSLHVRVL